MDFVETKFYYKNHVLASNLKIKNMSKKWPQKPKKCRFLYIHIKNVVTLEKYLNYFFENMYKNLINFEVFLVGKVPKSSVFNRESLENGDF